MYLFNVPGAMTKPLRCMISASSALVYPFARKASRSGSNCATAALRGLRERAPFFRGAERNADRKADILSEVARLASTAFLSTASPSFNLCAIVMCFALCAVEEGGKYQLGVARRSRIESRWRARKNIAPFATRSRHE
ncbi:hypothetical protein F7D13_16865 (plasmid) [Methylocystis rosea]|uniref:Uncharacterized protein n=1 Tax=Methylocystis rosea TaxID=173366 RepID=A0ABX6EM25_9HYPH|nr:hypothetical protein [Methylocystis rosea]QGM95779.1 hypothetical protein F7D13_16865 [Methylocystis rosea]